MGRLEDNEVLNKLSSAPLISWAPQLTAWGVNIYI